MPETRSALASWAARPARSGSASTEPAIWRASSVMRSMRSHCVPSFSWKVMPFSSKCIGSRWRFRSWSQKNLASDNRARITFSLPLTISAPPSAAIRFDTIRKRLASLPVFGSFSEKHFWWFFIAVVRHSPGTARNSASKVPIRTIGHSVRPAFSVSSASSSTSSSLADLATARACSRIISTRSDAGSSTLAALSRVP